MALGRRLFVRRKGRWELKLGADERELLASLADQLDELLSDEVQDPGVARLFPPAYPEDIDLEAEWQVFKAAELRDAWRIQIEVLRSTLDRTSLDDDEVLAWMQAVNALRLVLGNGLDVGEDDAQIDPSDPAAPAYALFDFLSYLVEATVTALSAR